MKLYIGNVSYNTSETTLRAFFEAFGQILSANIATERETGRSRGFAFVEYADRESAERAIAEANGAMLDGKSLVVNEARPKEGGSSGFRSGGNSRGGSRGGFSGGGPKTGYTGSRW